MPSYFVRDAPLLATPSLGNVDSATVAVKVTPSGADIAAIGDAGTVYVDIRPYVTVEVPVVRVKIYVHGGECYSRFHFSGEMEADCQFDMSDESPRWSLDTEDRWDMFVESQPGCTT